MGAWSGEPFGNDVAADWTWELEDVDTWDVVRTTLAEANSHPFELDQNTAQIALAAAEVVAHGIGRATQDDAYTGEITAFVLRAGIPSEDIVIEARHAVQRAASLAGPLAQGWAACGNDSWQESVERLSAALNAPR